SRIEAAPPGFLGVAREAECGDMTGVRQVEIAQAESGWRLDRWCRERMPALPFGQMQRLLRTGQLRVDGRRVAASHRLAGGERIRVPPMPDNEQPVAAVARASRPRPRDEKLIRSLILHEDGQLIALAKPAGLAVQGGTGTSRHLDAMLDALAS